MCGLAFRYATVHLGLCVNSTLKLNRCIVDQNKYHDHLQTQLQYLLSSNINTCWDIKVKATRGNDNGYDYLLPLETCERENPKGEMVGLNYRALNGVNEN